MGKYRLDFEKNRWEKIARNKIKRKNKKHLPYQNIFSSKNIKKKGKINRVYNVLNKNNFFIKVKSNNAKALITIPEIFCYINNPNETLKTSKMISYAMIDINLKNICIDYSNCITLGLDASLVTDIIVLEGLEIRKKLGSSVKLDGFCPKTASANEIFLNSGLVKHLGISKIESPNVERLDPFAYVKDPNLMTNKVIEYYNNCLKTSGFILNEKGINYFSRLVGEIIDNSSQHCGTYGVWYVSGHFTKDKESERIPKGKLTFISLGDTMYESLKYNTANPKIKNKLQNQTKKHKGLFNLNWNEESSWTVFALQWMISRKKTDENDRGTGTVKFIEGFTELGKTINNDIPKMVILSGHTHILFDGTYTLKTSKNNPKTKVIAFNKENDLGKRPDDKYVRLLKNKFPGTVISCEFFVDKEYLKKIKEEK